MVALNPVQIRDSFSDRFDCHLVLSSTDNDGRAKFEDVDGSVLCFPRGPSSRKEVTKENFETSLLEKENGKEGREKGSFGDSIGKPNVLRSELVVCINIGRKGKAPAMKAVRRDEEEEERKQKQKRKLERKNEEKPWR